MPLGIKAYIDFVFKKTFGSPENSIALIGLLNAILEPASPITEVIILNPFSYKEFESDKSVVLDVRAMDTTGRIYNIEMQVSIHPRLMERLVYYVCGMYLGQMSQGDSYAKLNSAISICLLTNTLFPDTPQAHHRFQMADLKSGRKLDRAIEVHTVELSKYNVDETSLAQASPLERWCWLILNAHKHPADELRRWFPEMEFQQAIGSFEKISSKTKDKAMYDQRERAERDYEWILASARQEAMEVGREVGREEGLEEGAVIGWIQALQQVLGDPFATTPELSGQSFADLQTLLTDLQHRVRSRPS